jgi:nicotinamidase-related amidase
MIKIAFILIFTFLPISILGMLKKITIITWNQINRTIQCHMLSRKKSTNTSKKVSLPLRQNKQEKQTIIDTTKTALVICDMWDQHHCSPLTKRTSILAQKMITTINKTRNLGIQVIHAPSGCMDYYEKYPQHKNIKSNKQLQPPIVPYDPKQPPLTEIFGHDCPLNPPCAKNNLWRTKQHQSIKIKKDDLISDNGTEIYSFLKEQKISNILFLGVHTNHCIMYRPFGIKNMVAWGLKPILIRDLTEPDYNYTKHQNTDWKEATEIVVEWIEKHYCPTISSKDLLSLK